MIPFSNYIINGQNSHHLMIKRKAQKSTSLTINDIHFITLVDELQSLMKQLYIKGYRFTFAFVHVPMSISLLAEGVSDRLFSRFLLFFSSYFGLIRLNGSGTSL